jgi:hypothetical protein
MATNSIYMKLLAHAEDEIAFWPQSNLFHSHRSTLYCMFVSYYTHMLGYMYNASQALHVSIIPVHFTFAAMMFCKNQPVLLVLPRSVASMRCEFYCSNQHVHAGGK